MVLRAWALYETNSNKASIWRILRKEFERSCPSLATLRGWLIEGERGSEEAQIPEGRLLTPNRAGVLLAEMAEERSAKVGERVSAIRTELERIGAFAPREVRIRATHEILGSQPVNVLNAAEAELIDELARLGIGSTTSPLADEELDPLALPDGGDGAPTPFPPQAGGEREG